MNFWIPFFIFCCAQLLAQDQRIDHNLLKEDLDQIILDLANHYIYLEEKNVDLNCLRTFYQERISSVQTRQEVLLLFEDLLNEFYDSHLILNANCSSSFRLFSPTYATIAKGKVVISDIWLTQIEDLNRNIFGAEIIEFNGTDLNTVIEQYPSNCNNKNDFKVREWIVNKILAGRYNQPRVLTLKLTNEEIISFDLDKLVLKSHEGLLSTHIENEIGIIRINNTLGNNNLIGEFDMALEQLKNTKGLIIDLRNTVDGGNSYVARGILGHFVEKAEAYQKHWTIEKYDGKTAVERSWVEYVSPRLPLYQKPVVILVGRWTGSMGEGLAIGFDPLENAKIVGTEMQRLAGEMNGFAFKHQNFGYRLSTAKLFHIDGTPREQFVPSTYVKQTNIAKDEALERGIEMIHKIKH